MSEQPDWEFVANLGDATPHLHGGLFLYRDRSGRYPPELERFEPMGPEDDDPTQWEVHRIVLERCTYTDGIMSDNAFHPENAAWFADSLDSVADACDYPGELGGIISDLESDDPLRLARAYRAVADHQGWIEFDEYPITLDRGDLATRYTRGEFDASRVADADDEPDDECPECGAEMDADCQGRPRCPECDEPCPDCYSGPGPLG